MGRVTNGWNKGTKKIRVETQGTSIKVFHNNKLQIEAIDEDHQTSSVVGIFSRGDGNGEFKKFTVKPNG